MSNRSHIFLAMALASCVTLAACGHKNVQSQGADSSTEPDKVLYERATNETKRGHYTEGRLALQTLINTYPDSEYLAKAKLALADSFYKEGGTSGLTQAVAEYQDFITFFPFLDEAAYAQMQIGMTHYRRMEKPDRDRNEAIEAEGAFQTYLQKYPNSQLYPQVQQHLREVQEVLAEGDFRIASFYTTRKVDRAAAARLLNLTSRYPLYSQADQANWMLATIYERNEHSDVAAQYYTRLVKDYPLSPLAGEAKDKLVKLGIPVPPPDPTAMARMQQEQQLPRQRAGLISRPLGMFKSGPDVTTAARTGTPTMTPPTDSPTETLTPGNLSLGGGRSAGQSGTGTGAFVESVTPGVNTGGGPTGGASTGGASTGGSVGGSSAPDNPAATGSSVVAAPAAPDAASGNAVTNALTPAPSVNVTEQPAADAVQPSTTGTGASVSTDPAPQPTTADPKNESSSKKKKGVRKVVPF